MRSIIPVILLAGLLCGVPFAQTAKRNSAQPTKSVAAPSVIPCRTKDGNNKDLFVMTLGDVKPTIADGTYDLTRDQVKHNDGSVIDNYYRNTLGLKYFKPIDKSIFPLPPSGWCSWYYYYQDISDKEVERNAKWIADNLKDYGAQYVQIDDGWQGEGRGSARDWTIVSFRFPKGMDKLAAYIKSVGLTPGLWLAPHGQSNEEVVKKSPNIFLMKPDGSTASSTWEGKYLIDPSTPETQAYLKDMFTKFSGWGYEYFKIDGQPVVVGEYKTKKSFMKNPADDTDGLYRKTIETIRDAIGENRYLLGCWGEPVEGAGIMNGSRTGGDVVLGWDGFRVALRATLQNYYQHNVLWYADPDVMLLRSPLTIDQARAWATLQGLTGQALMSSDRLMDLSEDRVDIMRRVYPAVDIRPLDLFPTDRNKRIWDLKINHLNRNYDVVGVFNYEQGKSEQTYLSWKDLGIPDDTPVHVFDFWNKEYLGAWEKGFNVDAAPTSVRVLTLVPATDQIQLVSTNRHITQGWVDLASLNQTGDSFTGKSKVIKDDPYELRFAFPKGKNYAVKQATARTASGVVPVKISNHQGWATVQFTSPRTTDVNWTISFEPSDIYHYAVREPANLAVERVGINGVNVTWNSQYYLNAGYQLFLDGKMVGYTPSNSFPLRGLDPNKEYNVEVKSVWDDGTVNQKKSELKFTIKNILPTEINLAEIEPSRAIQNNRNFDANRVLGGRGMSLGGKRFATGVGTRLNSDIEYDLKGLFDNFSAQVGFEDVANNNANNNDATVEFILLADDKEIWKSGQIKRSDGPKIVNVNTSGVQKLTLRVTGSNRMGRGQFDWADARLIRKTN